jgi:predicted phage terminase large subunit-like protein
VRQLVVHLARLRAAQAPAALPPLLDWIPQATPNRERPVHLKPLIDVLERAWLAARGLGPPVFALVSAPPQVGKTETGQHAFAHWLIREPRDFLAYVTYGSDLAATKSRKVRDLVREAGVALRTDSRAVDLWNTTAGGGMLARGINAGITGQSGVKLVWVDDPFKNRVQAESKGVRENVYNDFWSTIFSRRHPTTSVIVSHTRWHEDDLVGRLKKMTHPISWEVVNIKAISDDGEPLWPESGRTLEFWQTQRADEYTWWSLYMGEPRPRGGKIFNSPTTYSDDDQIPPLRYAIGLDLAYTGKTQSDWSVAVVVGRGSDGRAYVVDVLRRQCQAPEFAAALKSLQAKYPGAPTRWYVGATEAGSAQFMQRDGVRLAPMAARGDKFTRALPVAAAWNAGRVVVKSDEKWSADFVGELLDFSGKDDPHDDQVDALAAGFDALDSGTSLVAPIKDFNRAHPMGQGPRTGSRRAAFW